MMRIAGSDGAMEKLALRKFLLLIDMAFLASSWFHLRKSAFRLFLCALCALCVSVVNVSFSNSRVLVSAREFSREDCARDFVRRWPIFHSAVGLAFGSSLLQRVLAGLPLRTVPNQSL
jgi:hypothetical protein